MEVAISGAAEQYHYFEGFDLADDSLDDVREGLPHLETTGCTMRVMDGRDLLVSLEATLSRAARTIS